jgi:hypothetical protein
MALMLIRREVASAMISDVRHGDLEARIDFGPRRLDKHPELQRTIVADI